MTKWRNLIILLVVLCLITFMSNSVMASNSNNVRGAFARSGVGARALAFGGAFVGLADDATAVYWNPAGLGFMLKSNVSTMYNDLFGLGLIKTGFVGYVQPDKGGGLGASGLGWTYIGGDLGGGNKWTENTLTYIYGKRVHPYVSTGLALKGLFVSTKGESYETVEGTRISAKGFSADFGVIVAFNNELRFGAVIYDLYSVLTWENTLTSPKEKLPLVYTIGMVYKKSIFTVCTDISGGEEAPLKKYALGGELRFYNDMFMVRGGFSQDIHGLAHLNPVIGIGINYKNMFSFDYAYEMDSHTLGDMQRFSISGSIDK